MLMINYASAECLGWRQRQSWICDTERNIWQNNIMWNVVNSRMDSKESFSSFANCVIAGNNLLDGTDVYLNAGAVRATAEMDLTKI